MNKVENRANQLRNRAAGDGLADVVKELLPGESTRYRCHFPIVLNYVLGSFVPYVPGFLSSTVLYIFSTDIGRFWVSWSLVPYPVGRLRAPTVVTLILVVLLVDY